MTEFLHGVEVVEVDEGPRPVRSVRSAVVGLVGTAEKGPVNTPTLVAGDRARGAALFGDAGTIPAALSDIFDQIGAVVVVVNCLDPAVRNRDVTRRIALVAGGLTIPDALMRAASLVVKDAGGAVTYRADRPNRQGDYRYDVATRRLTRVDRAQQAVAAAPYVGVAGVWTLPTQRVANVVVQNAAKNRTYRADLPNRQGDFALDAAAGILTRTARVAGAQAVAAFRAPAGATGVINLPHQRISNVVVRNQLVAQGATVYTANTDYSVDADAGTITRIAAGSSYRVSQDVYIGYTVLAGPGPDDTLSIAYQRAAGMGDADTLTLEFDVPDASAATIDDVAGETDGNGDYSGIHALLGAESSLGLRPRILCAPGWSDQLAVGQSLIARAERLRATAVIEGPASTDAEAIAYAGNLTASRRGYLVDPQLRYSDGDGGTVDRGASAAVAGVIARTDHELGFWWSPSNRPVAGALGTSRAIDFALGDPAARANLLNEANVATIIRENGYRLWGNRTLSADAKFQFLSVARTADLIQDALQRSHLWAVDRNITRTYLSDVAEGVRAYIAELVGLGALAGGDCVPSDLNTAGTIRDGRAYFDVDFTPYSPAERVTFRVALVDDHLEELL